MSDHPRSEQKALDALKDPSTLASSGGIESKSAKKALAAALKEANESMSRNLGCPYRPFKLNDMPLECLEAIFTRVPMQQLVSKHRLVCSYWCENIEAICRRKAKSLVLHDQPAEIQNLLLYISVRLFGNIKPKNFIRIYFNPQQEQSKEMFNQFLLRLFPHPTELIILFKHEDVFSQFPLSLLSGWFQNLITFSILYDNKESSNHVNNFINNCSTLRQLDLNVSAEFGRFGFSNLTINVAILKALEHFSYFSKVSVFRGLRKLMETDSQCTRLYYGECESNHLAHKIIEWAESNPKVSSKLTHLKMKIRPEIIEKMPSLLSQLSSLKVLILFSSDSGLAVFDNRLACFQTSLFKALARLTSLIELKFELLILASNFLLPANHIPLSSVKKFTFMFISYQHRVPNEVKNGFYPALAAYFPSLEELMVANHEGFNPEIVFGAFGPFAARFTHLKKYNMKSVTAK